MRKIVYRKVGWRKHLIPNQREWINDYMQTHGVEFYTRAVDLINQLGSIIEKSLFLQSF